MVTLGVCKTKKPANAGFWFVQIFAIALALVIREGDI